MKKKTRIYYEVDSWTEPGGVYILQQFMANELGLIAGMLSGGMVIQGIRRIECGAKEYESLFG